MWKTPSGPNRSLQRAGPRPRCAAAARSGLPWVAVLLALGWFGPGGAWGQERRPLVNQEFAAQLDFEGEFFRDVTKSRQGSSARTVIQHSVFRNYFRSTMGGYSFDPRLLRYRLGLELGYDAHRSIFRTPGLTPFPRDRSATALRISYDLLLEFFPESMNSLSVWSRRRDYLMSQLLWDTFEVQEQAYGARFDTRWPVLPSSFQYEYRNVKSRSEFESEREETHDFLYQAQKDFGPNNTLNILYEYLRLRRITRGQFQTPSTIREDEDTQRAEVWHEYRFGSELRSSLLSQASVLDQTGTFPFRNFLARERLVLQHTPNFQTYYGLIYQKTEVGLSKVETETIEVGLRHQLYDNLITRIEGRLRHSDETTLSWNEGDILGNWSYRRHNPFGEMFLNYLVRETRRHFSDGFGTTNRLNNYFEFLQEFRNYVRVYYRIEDQQLKVPLTQAMTITNSTLQTVGYEIPWREFTWLQEYRHLNDTLGLTESLRSELRANYALPWAATLRAALLDEEIDYHGRLPKSRISSLEFDYLMPFARTGMWNVEAIFDDQTGVVVQKDLRFRSTVEWQYRRLKMRLLGQYGLFRNQAVEEQGTHLLFTLSRELR